MTYEDACTLQPGDLLVCTENVLEWLGYPEGSQIAVHHIEDAQAYVKVYCYFAHGDRVMWVSHDVFKRAPSDHAAQLLCVFSQ